MEWCGGGEGVISKRNSIHRMKKEVSAVSEVSGLFKYIKGAFLLDDQDQDQ